MGLCDSVSMRAGTFMRGSSSLPITFRNGVAYAVRRETFLKTKTVIGENTLGVVIDRPLVNIDDPFELRLADWWLSQESR
jgi:hypothetical protein